MEWIITASLISKCLCLCLPQNLTIAERSVLLGLPRELRVMNPPATHEMQETQV